MSTPARSAALVVVGGVIAADFAGFTLYRGLTAGDLLLLAGFVLAVLAGAPLVQIPLWYWILAILFGAGTIIAQLGASAGMLGAWGLHWYFYVLVLPVTWSLVAADPGLLGRAAAMVVVSHSLVALEVLLRVARFKLAWWTGPAVPLVGGLSNTAALAIALMLALGLLVREWLNERRLVVLAALAGGVCLLAGGVLVGNKRTVWAATALGVGVMLLFVHRRISRATVSTVAATILAGALLLQAAPPVRDRVIVAAQAALNPDRQLDSSYSARLMAQRRVLKAFFDGPWSNVFFGFGYRQSARHVGSSLAASSTGGAHNTFVNYLVETGLAGVLPLAALWAAVTLSAIVVFFRARRLFHGSTTDTMRCIAPIDGALVAAIVIVLVELLFAPDVYLRLAFFIAGATLAMASLRSR